jgi:hypothetical protein
LVWRELRRLKQKLGVFAKRKDQPLRLAYDNAVNTETGECKLGHYDGNFIQTIKGLLYEGQMITTRFFNWRLERTNEVCFNLEFCK